MANQRLDWTLLMQGWNDKFGTDYTNILTWLTDLQRTRGGQTNANMLGVSHTVYYSKINELHIPHFKRPLILRVEDALEQFEELGYFEPAKILRRAIRNGRNSA